MGAWEIVSLVVLAGAFAVVSALLVFEIKVWWPLRSHPTQAGRAAKRLLRRGAGALLLLLVLVLLKFPGADSLSPVEQLWKMIACLLLCATVFFIAIWDFRVLRREVRHEVEGFLQQSAGAFRKHLEELAAENPELGEKMLEQLCRREAGGTCRQDAGGTERQSE